MRHQVQKDRAVVSAAALNLDALPDSAADSVGGVAAKLHNVKGVADGDDIVEMYGGRADRPAELTQVRRFRLRWVLFWKTGRPLRHDTEELAPMWRTFDEWVTVVVGSLRDGSWLDLAPGEDVDVAGEWPVGRLLPGAAIREALLSVDLRPDPQGLRIRAAKITGNANLARLRIPYGLSFLHCGFEAPIVWTGLVASYLSVCGSYVPGCCLKEMRLDGALNLRRTVLSSGPDGTALRLDGAEIKGGAFLGELQASSEVRALGASIVSQLDLQQAVLTNEGGGALTMDGAEVKGDAFLGGLRATGEVRALGASVTGNLGLQQAILNNDGGNALSLDGAEIKGGAFLGELQTIGTVRALGVSVTGQLDLQQAVLTSEGGDALTMDGAQIRGDALLGGLQATGAVRARRTRIAGQFDLHEAVLINEGGDALNIDGAEINGHASLQGLQAAGEVRALGVSIDGQLDLQHAVLTNEDGDALSLDGAEIRGHAFLQGLQAIGEVRGPWVRVTGNLGLQQAVLTNNDGDALNLDGAEIKGGAYLRELRATGAVRADGASIAGELDLERTVLSSEKFNALDLATAHVARLRLAGATVTGSISLASTRIDEITTTEGLRASRLDMAGWKVGDIRDVIRHNRKAAATLLRIGHDDREFVAQPWHEIANVYERNGQPSDARWMRWQAARGTTRISPIGARIIRTIYGALTGHGYFPLLAAIWLIASVVATGAIVGTHADVLTPTATNRVELSNVPPSGQAPPRPITGATPCRDLKDPATCLHPILYAFDSALPGALSTGQTSLWTANGATNTDVWVPYVLGGLRVFGWILVALLLAGVTGLLRRT